MKKFLSILLIFIFTFSLTACDSNTDSKKETSKEKTIVATKEEDDIESKVEIKFNSDDEPKSIKWVLEYEDKDDAKDVYEELEEMIEEFEEEEDEEELGIKAKRSGKKITLEIDPSSDFCSLMLGIDDDSSYEDVEEMLDDADWDIK